MHFEFLTWSLAATLQKRHQGTKNHRDVISESNVLMHVTESHLRCANPLVPWACDPVQGTQQTASCLTKPFSVAGPSASLPHLHPTPEAGTCAATVNAIFYSLILLFPSDTTSPAHALTTCHRGAASSSCCNAPHSAPTSRRKQRSHILLSRSSLSHQL